MSNALDIVQLRTFVAIAECGGFGRAAAALHLSQSTVSQHVRGLERGLDQTLVVREGRRARFTAAGEALLTESRRILAVHDEALARLDASHAGTITVGASETAAEQILPQMLTRLSRAYADRLVQFRLERSTQLTDAVAKGIIDLAVVLDTGNAVPGTEVGALPLRWFAAPGWTPPPAAEPVPLVAYVEPCGMRQRALQGLGTLGRRVEITAESGNVEGVIAAARAGLGIAVLPSAGVAPHGLDVRRDLPELGVVHVRVLARRGLEPGLESAALDALRAFFAARSRTSQRTASDAFMPRP